MPKTDTSQKWPTSLILSPVDRRHIRNIIKKGYASTIAGAIRYALAVTARSSDA